MNILKILYTAVVGSLVAISITRAAASAPILVEDNTTTTTAIIEETTTEIIEETTVEETTTTTQTAAPKTDSSDLDLLAKIIYLEAGGCTYRHKQLVGCVVINRVNSSKFPNTVEDVVYQKNQYYPRGSKYLANAKPDSECYEIARDLLANGNHGICPSNILFQAEFVQGEVYEVIVSPYGSTTYFCYG